MVDFDKEGRSVVAFDGSCGALLTSGGIEHGVRVLVGARIGGRAGGHFAAQKCSRGLVGISIGIGVDVQAEGSSSQAGNAPRSCVLHHAFGRHHWTVVHVR